MLLTSLVRVVAAAAICSLLVVENVHMLFLYIKFQEEGTNAILNTPEQLLTFLGTIDSASEAILWSNVNGYSHSSSSKETGAIQKVDDHFELLVSELVSGCLPYQTDQVHLRIDPDGKITELDRAVYSYAKNSCI